MVSFSLCCIQPKLLAQRASVLELLSGDCAGTVHLPFNFTIFHLASSSFKTPVPRIQINVSAGDSFGPIVAAAIIKEALYRQASDLLSHLDF